MAELYYVACVAIKVTISCVCVLCLLPIAVIYMSVGVLGFTACSLYKTGIKKEGVNAVRIIILMTVQFTMETDTVPDNDHDCALVDDWIACKMIEIDHALAEQRHDSAFHFIVELIHELTHTDHVPNNACNHIQFIAEYYQRILVQQRYTDKSK